MASVEQLATCVKSLENHFAELPHVKITQGYLAFDERGVEVRLRKVCEARLLVLTLQHGDMRVEREIKLTDAQFDELWPATKGRRLRKARYWMPHDGLTVEIDVYKGHASRIKVAAIEFPDRVSGPLSCLAQDRCQLRARHWCGSVARSKRHNRRCFRHRSHAQFAIGRAAYPAIQRSQDTCCVDDRVCSCGPSSI
jgi:CYTH domain-containing protein